MTGTSHSRNAFLVRCGSFLFRYRDAASPLVFVALLLITRAHQPYGSAALDKWLDLAGILVSASGQALRIAVIGFAYIIRGGKARKVYAEDLVTAGFFAASRNPLYLGNLLIYFGLILVWNSPLMYALAVPFYLFLYISIVAAEEEYLRTKFGPGYDAYCNDVPRWIPRPSRLRAGLEGMAFNWKRVILKEYGTVTAWSLTAMVLLLLETSHFSSISTERTRVTVLAACTIIIVTAWAVIRWLKLSRRLVA